jgi:hypothetical protein
MKPMTLPSSFTDGGERPGCSAGCASLLKRSAAGEQRFQVGLHVEIVDIAA